MAVGDRVDPVQIIARVGGVRPGFGGPERAFQVWVDLARKAGWEVFESPGFQEVPDSTECGAVVIEGLPYQVHYGRRVRQILADDSTGHLEYRPVLAYAAWAEPVFEEQS